MGTPQRFIPLATAFEGGPPDMTIEVETNGARVPITGGVNADLVAAILKALTRR